MGRTHAINVSHIAHRGNLLHIEFSLSRYFNYFSAPVWLYGLSIKNSSGLLSENAKKSMKNRTWSVEKPIGWSINIRRAGALSNVAMKILYENVNACFRYMLVIIKVELPKKIQKTKKKIFLLKIHSFWGRYFQLCRCV